MADFWSDPDYDVNAGLAELQKKYKDHKWGDAPTLWHPKKHKQYGPTEQEYEAWREQNGPWQTPDDPTYKDDMMDWRENAYRSQFDDQHNFIKDHGVRDVDGKPLPTNALGWDWNGEAYYGSGVSAYWKKASDRVWFDDPEKEVESNRGWRATKASVGFLVDNLDHLGKWGKRLVYAGGNYAMREAQELVDIKYDGTGVERPTVDLFHPEDNPKSSGEYIGDAWADRIDRWETGLEDFMDNILTLGVQALDPRPIGKYLQEGNVKKTVHELFTMDQEEHDLWVRDVNLGRVAFTSYWEGEGVLEEYKRRVKEGEDPWLLARELENPWVEMGAEIVFDPMWIVGKVTAPLKGIIKTSNASKFLNYADEVAEVVSKVRKAGSKIIDGDAVKYTDEILQAAKIAGEKATKAGAKINTVQGTHGLFSWTSKAKQYIFGAEMKSIGDQIMSAADDAEHAGELMRAWKNLTHADDAVRAEAIATILDTPLAPVLMSDGGFETSVLLNRMFDKAGGEASFLKKITGIANEFHGAADDLDDVARIKKFEDLFDAMTEKPLQEMFPSVLERMAKGENFAPWTRAAAKFYDKVEGPVTGVNKFFAAVYMGMSPGYAMRNAFSNITHIVIDEGPGALFKGGVTNFGIGGTTTRLEREIFEWIGFAPDLGGFGTQAASFATEKTSGILGKLPFTKLSEHFERTHKMKLYLSGVEDTMRKAMRPGFGLPSLDGLKKAGLTDETAEAVWRSVVKHKGDVKKASAELMKNLENGGVVDLFGSMHWIPEKDADFLRHFGVMDELQRAIDEDLPIEDIIGRMSVYFDETIEHARKGVVNNVGSLDNTASPAAQATAQIVGALERQGVFAAEEMSELMWHGQATEQYFDVASEFITQLYRRDPKNAFWGQEIAGMKMKDFLAKGAKQQADNLSDAMNADVWAYNDRIFKMEPDEVRTVFEKLGLSGDVDALLGQGQAGRKIIKDKLWKEYWMPSKRAIYERTRDVVFDQIQTAMREIQPKNVSTLADQVKANYEYFKMMDNVLARQEYTYQLQNATRNADKVRIIANKFGFHTVEDAGQSLGSNRDKQLLNLINAYADETYASLDDVPYEVADKAFDTRFRIKSGMANEWGQIEKVRKSTMKGIQGMFQEAGIKVGFVPRTVDGATSFAVRIMDDNNKWVTIGYSKTEKLDGWRTAAEAVLRREGLATNAEKTRASWGGVYDKFQDVAKGRWGSDFVEKADGAADELWSLTDQWSEVPPGLKTPSGAELKVGPDGKTYARIDPKHTSVGEVLDGPPPTRPPTDQTPMPFHVTWEQAKALREHENRLYRLIRQNYGAKGKVYDVPGSQKAAAEWFKKAEEGMAQARQMAHQVGAATAEFGLHDYNKRRNFDLGLGLIYPYAFWYSRTYPKWVKRMVAQPQILSAYTKYKNTMAKVHAGAPEWWKYNVEINNVPPLGITKENPIFFNLEATLNPLNGLTGVDFNDPVKREGWFAKTVDDMNKFGPSVWTPIQHMVAISLMAQGEEEAAARWGGRLIPQTRQLKNLATVLGLEVKIGEGINEFDPAVHFYSNGLDPYERRRVGRQLYQMVVDGDVSFAQAMDAAKNQSGRIWEAAQMAQTRKRAPGELAGFMFGVGFKARHPSEIQIDRYDAKVNRIWTMSEHMGPEWVRAEWDKVREEFPFGSLVTLSRKGGIERDRSYAYDVLGRLPPGYADDILAAAGAPKGLFGKFYDTGGHIEKWTEGDRNQFMNAVVAAGGVFDMPDDATREEWDIVRAKYKRIQDGMVERYGEDIHAQIDNYYSLSGDRTKQDLFLQANPAVEDAMNFKDVMIKNDEQTAAYYMTLDKMERYYRSLMYDSLYQDIGVTSQQMDELWKGYNKAKLDGSQKRYWKEHPELQAYVDNKDVYEEIIAKVYATAGAMLKEPQFAPVRQDLEEPSMMQENILQMQQPAETEFDMTWQDWQAEMSPELGRIVRDHLIGGERLTTPAKQQLEYLAGQLDISYDVMLELMDESITKY